MRTVFLVMTWYPPRSPCCWRAQSTSVLSVVHGAAYFLHVVAERLLRSGRLTPCTGFASRQVLGAVRSTHLRLGGGCGRVGRACSGIGSAAGARGQRVFAPLRPSWVLCCRQVPTG